MTLSKRTRNCYDPTSRQPYKLSRSKLEDFIKCPRCLYLDRRLGIAKPSIPAFTLNSAVDHLLKKEFDIYRAKAEPHPLMKKYEIGAIPFSHPELDTWRENFKGVQVSHEPTHLIISGAIDDLWVKPDGELLVVDYKSTSKEGEVTLEDPWKESYKCQMEIYQWLLRKKGFRVSNTGYFVYANADKALSSFEGKLCFNMTVISYQGNSDWVEGAVVKASECLNRDVLPQANQECEYCIYRGLVEESETTNPPKSVP